MGDRSRIRYESESRFVVKPKGLPPPPNQFMSPTAAPSTQRSFEIEYGQALDGPGTHLDYEPAPPSFRRPVRQMSKQTLSSGSDGRINVLQVQVDREPWDTRGARRYPDDDDRRGRDYDYDQARSRTRSRRRDRDEDDEDRPRRRSRDLDADDEYRSKSRSRSRGRGRNDDDGSRHRNRPRGGDDEDDDRPRSRTRRRGRDRDDDDDDRPKSRSGSRRRKGGDDDDDGDERSKSRSRSRRRDDEDDDDRPKSRKGRKKKSRMRKSSDSDDGEGSGKAPRKGRISISRVEVENKESGGKPKRRRDLEDVEKEPAPAAVDEAEEERKLRKSMTKLLDRLLATDSDSDDDDDIRPRRQRSLRSMSSYEDFCRRGTRYPSVTGMGGGMLDDVGPEPEVLYVLKRTGVVPPKKKSKKKKKKEKKRKKLEEAMRRAEEERRKKAEEEAKKKPHEDKKQVKITVSTGEKKEDAAPTATPAAAPAAAPVAEPAPVLEAPTDLGPPLDVKVPVVFILGGPGSGKGTQCENIVKKYEFTHISTGDLLRAEVESGSDRGKALNDIMVKGDLVPPTIVLQLLKETMKSGLDTAKGYLIDGYPRNLEQADDFEKFVCKVTKVVYFEVKDETMVQRLLERGKTSGRADDNEETIKKRVETFHKESEPVIGKYPDLLEKVSAEDAPDKVFEAVVPVFDKLLEK